MFSEIFIFIGLVTLICMLLKILISVFPYFFNEQNIIKKYGNGYAVVTGGTDGIGLKITKKLLNQGLNVYVIGIKTNLIQQNDLPENSYLVEGDLSDSSFVKKICDWILQNHPILLINCAGLCIPQTFETIDNPSKYIDAHISSLVELTSAFIKARNQQGGIVFFSSQVALFTSPFATLYAATKSFIAQFADSLSAEYPKLDILCVFPGAVNGTSFFNHFPNHWYFNIIRFIGQKSDTVASLILKALGRVRLVDTGLLTYGTRIASSFLDQNIINFAGQLASSSLHSQLDSKYCKTLPL